MESFESFLKGFKVEKFNYSVFIEIEKDGELNNVIFHIINNAVEQTDDTLLMVDNVEKLIADVKNFYENIIVTSDKIFESIIKQLKLNKNEFTDYIYNKKEHCFWTILKNQIDDDTAQKYCDLLLELDFIDVLRSQ